jgi:hypothetical protein
LPKATNAFPQLISYEGCWPVNDLMLLHLKNTARREKLKLEKEDAAAARAAAAKNDRKRS